MHVIKQKISSFVQANEDEPPPLVPRKFSAADQTIGKALPNTYVQMKESTKTGGALFNMF